MIPHIKNPAGWEPPYSVNKTVFKTLCTGTLLKSSTVLYLFANSRSYNKYTSKNI